MKKLILRTAKLFPKKLLKQFGFYPIDRYYINMFIKDSSSLDGFPSHGTSLEFGEIRYSKFFEGTRYKWLYANKFSIDGNIVTGDILDNNDIKIQFDLIVSTQVITFVSNPELYMEKVCALLKPNGFLLLTSPGLGVFTSKYDAARWGDFGRYSMQTLINFVPAGFKISSNCGYGNFNALRKLNNNVSAFRVRESILSQNEPNEEVVFGLIITRDNA
jgi:hypothetical protein